MASEPQAVEVDGEQYEYTSEKPWRDEKLLQTLYWEKKMTQSDISDVVGCSQRTIHIWMDKLGIKTQSSGGRTAFDRASYSYNNGYMMWQDGVSNEHLFVHRLLAISEHGFEAVCEKEVHHKNQVPWDNRPQNIEIKTSKQHQHDHMEERYGEAPWRDEEHLRELYVGKNLSSKEIADRWGCGQSTISRWLNEHGIETRSRGRPPKEGVEQNQQTLTEAE